MAKNTIVVILSDHGEEFWDHGKILHGPTLYRELTRILLMFHSPDLDVGAKRIDTNVSIIDVLPTLLDLVGGPPVKNAEGISLAPLLRGKDSSLRSDLSSRVLFAHRIHAASRDRTLWAAMKGSWKLIHKWNGVKMLFDHSNDPTEQMNLIPENPPKASELEKELLGHIHEGEKSRFNSEQVEILLDENMIKQLKKMGYFSCDSQKEGGCLGDADPPL
ncbi:MAG: sulfatase-like hydrolase/transferase [Proteobacteria bacterium]|nr:sulfatase-like hydrolase/transferase [Pseudomonadota bacterium]